MATRTMHTTTAQKRAIDHYYQELAAYHEKKVTHETAVRYAFQNLLFVFAQSANWMLIPEQTLANGKRPDGTLRDSFNLPRGYWEAKDTKDDLTSEIRKKISIGYPTTNTIFEDTRKAILYQNNRPVLEADLTRPKELTSVLDSFFHYAEPDIATFEHAVDDFQESIPDLAQGLLERIKEEHTKNKAFVIAFSSFLDLCRTSLDPNMSHETVDEMLVQHLLTERLFRTIFNNPDFTRRNVIATEIEKVIEALTSRAFDRNEFTRKLDRFYIVIENAAKNLDDWSEKQHFLNTVYERFFQSFSKKQADTHGIVYTPQEIVEFMCASVDVILKREFGSSLSTPGVQILDPCVGTGNFIVNLIQKHISGSSLASKYENELAAHDPLRHIAIQILQFSLSFEAEPRKVRNILFEALQSQGDLKLRCEDYASHHGFRNLDHMLDYLVFETPFAALVIIDEIPDNLEKILLTRFQFGVEVLELAYYTCSDDRKYYRFEPFLADVNADLREALPNEKQEELITQDDIDTIVVPAREDGFQETFLKENRWYAIRIHATMRPQIKYIAVYQVAPQNLRYTNYERLVHAQSLDDIWGQSGMKEPNEVKPGRSSGIE